MGKTKKTELEKFNSYNSFGKLIYSIFIAHTSLINLILFVLAITLPTFAYIYFLDNTHWWLAWIFVWLFITGIQVWSIYKNPKKWLLDEIV